MKPHSLFGLGIVPVVTVALLAASDILAEPRDVIFGPDVSASVTSLTKPPATKPVIDRMIADGKALVADLVKGSFEASRHPNWSWNPDLLIGPLKDIVEGTPEARPLTGPTRRLVMLPFAERAQPGRPVPHQPVVSDPIVNFPADFEAFFAKSYPADYRDQNTYVERALAETARVAEANGINDYYYFMISDGLNSAPPGDVVFAPEDREMLTRWKSKNFVAEKTTVASFQYRGAGATDRNFGIEVWQISLILPEPEISLVLTKPESATVRPGDLSLEWALETKGTRSKPSGHTFALAVTGPSGATVHSETLPGRYQTIVSLRAPGLHSIRISGSAGPGSASSKPVRIGTLTHQLMVAEEPPPPPPPETTARLVLTKPATEGPGPHPVPVTEAGAVEVEWAVESEDGQRIPSAGMKFRTELIPEGTAQPSDSQETEETRASLQTGSPSQPHRLKISVLSSRGDLAVKELNMALALQAPAPVVSKSPALRITAPPVPPIEGAEAQVQGADLLLKWRIDPPAETPATSYRITFSGPSPLKPVTTSKTMHLAKIGAPGLYKVSIEVLEPASLRESIPPVRLLVRVTSPFPWPLALGGTAAAGVGFLLFRALTGKKGRTGKKERKPPASRRSTSSAPSSASRGNANRPRRPR